jgi:hypothetical protein
MMTGDRDRTSCRKETGDLTDWRPDEDYGARNNQNISSLAVVLSMSDDMFSS